MEKAINELLESARHYVMSPEEMEEQRRSFYMTRSELKSVKDRLEDKKSMVQNYSNESEFLIKKIFSKDHLFVKSGMNQLTGLLYTME